MKTWKSISAALPLTAAVLLAGCGGSKPEVAALPPPPPAIVVPPQPQPPNGASPNVTIPMVDAMGVRQTVNTTITPAQTTWNFRSAYNVAALNCLQPQHAQIVVNYREFLRIHAKKLTAANKQVDNEFKTRYGARFVAPREAYMTQVYNYFALPPTLPAFCDAALAISAESTTVPPAELDAFAARSLPALERVFLQFYRAYDQYKVDLAGWQGKYMSPSATPPQSPATPLTASAPATSRMR